MPIPRIHVTSQINFDDIIWRCLNESTPQCLIITMRPYIIFFRDVFVTLSIVNLVFFGDKRRYRHKKHHEVSYMGPNVNEIDQNCADEFYRSIHGNLHNYPGSLIKHLASSKSCIVCSPYHLTNHVRVFISVMAVPNTSRWWLGHLMCMALSHFVRGHWMQM